MFEHLAGFKAVFVCGPQRSGTRICTNMIGHDTGAEVIEQDRFGVANVGNFNRLVGDNLQRKEHRAVYQCPKMEPQVETFAAREDVAVVFMDRPPEEVQASWVRIGAGANCLQDESNYDARHAWWASVQDKVAHPFTVQYHSLKPHPLWLDDRKDFGPGQTRRKA